MLIIKVFGIKLPIEITRRREEGDMQMREWLLIAIGDKMQPIQLQKTLFKFAMESGIAKKLLYDFEPYDWGPCSFEIYRDLDVLVSGGLVNTVPSGRGWNYYQLTVKGEKLVSKLRESSDEEKAVTQLEDIRGWVVNRTFQQLLEGVYQQYPEYAERSLFTN